MRARPVPALLLVAALAGCGGGSTSRAVDQPAAGWSAAPNQVAQISAVPHAGAVHADPVRLTVSGIGVQSALERLTTDSRGELSPPRDPARAGWYTGSVRPGDPGPAIIAGHVDSRTGPAVFTRLDKLKPGVAIVITDARGGTVRFIVDAVHSFAKARFPTAQVYGATPDPELRLITCGGDFDRASGHYVNNVVVFASLSP